ncbi:hypothetical protein P9D34_13485 [Bacillus swezeyi]|uniref:Uncharacterized protein n=1 Tax=Bacillus swezeyi TaxID=1925020 RepID=A0A1R1RP91_9BACI|nr:hypothetical protein [Bacillus swezeyi]MEC1261445.1 hypothetical protein [Bacillus swezeyi]MED2926692.1 hypothetical protein [Bacillus swezeyi]MED2944165.1 hypothetical protein [Bacillus swezeyi]MED2965746.1 hypothetical protein [Bacillus swezeyi]MED3070851.1 hypothetical protein [Bacillus swezeyi]
MLNVKEHFSPNVTTVVFIFLVIVVFLLDEMWKRYKTKQERAGVRPALFVFIGIAFLTPILPAMLHDISL